MSPFTRDGRAALATRLKARHADSIVALVLDTSPFALFAPVAGNFDPLAQFVRDFAPARRRFWASAHVYKPHMVDHVNTEPLPQSIARVPGCTRRSSFRLFIPLVSMPAFSFDPIPLPLCRPFTHYFHVATRFIPCARHPWRTAQSKHRAEIFCTDPVGQRVAGIPSPVPREHEDRTYQEPYCWVSD